MTKIIQPNMPASTPTKPAEQKAWPGWIQEQVGTGGIYKGATPPSDTGVLWIDTND